MIEGTYDWSLFKSLTYENFIQAIEKFNYEKRVNGPTLMAVKVLMAHTSFETFAPTELIMSFVYNFVKTVLENNKEEAKKE